MKWGWLFTRAMAAQEEDISHSTGLPSRYLRTIFRGHMEPSVNWAQKVSLGDDGRRRGHGWGRVQRGENVVGIMDGTKVRWNHIGKPEENHINAYRKPYTGWWFQTCVIFREILGMSSSQLTKSHFSEGWVNHQPDDVRLDLYRRWGA